MSFYVTLPSNASKEDYPNNTLTHFTTKLKQPLSLEGNYEVGLVGIMYPKTWKYRQDGEIEAKFDDINVKVKVEFFIQENLNELCQRLTDAFKDCPIQIEFEYSLKSQKVYISIPEKVTMIFKNGVAKDFGLSNDTFIGKKDKKNKLVVYKSVDRVRNELSNIHSFYVYSPNVQYNIVGDVNAPLLQIVGVCTEKSISYVDKIYDMPHYIPVSRNNIDTIEIDIRSEFGEPIYFTSGTVVVKLHFKKTNYYGL